MIFNFILLLFIIYFKISISIIIVNFNFVKNLLILDVLVMNSQS